MNELRRRYERQTQLPEVGVSGQQRLANSSVAIVGIGGLGSPVAIYLAAIGVGSLTLIDHDRVDPSNLHRQILFGPIDIGQPKVRVAGDALRKNAPDTRIVTVDRRLSEECVDALIRDHDIVVDCTDNFRTRYLLSDACVLRAIPLVSASIMRFDAQIAILCADELPCYRCLYPTPVAPGKIDNCSEAGVLGSFVGMIGAMQAHETAKFVLGLPSLTSQLLLVRGLEMDVERLDIARDPMCPACLSRKGRVNPLPGITTWPFPLPDDACHDRVRDRSISWGKSHDVLTQSGSRLIDVRSREEYLSDGRKGADHIPLDRLRVGEHDLDPDRDVVLYCRSGARSRLACAFLIAQGFARAWHVEGGIASLTKVADAPAGEAGESCR